MKSPGKHTLFLLLLLLMPAFSRAAVIVPAEIQLFGTQPNEVSNLESPNRVSILLRIKTLVTLTRRYCEVHKFSFSLFG